MVSSTALVERPVGTNALVPVATPAFIAEHGMPAAPADFQTLPSVGLPNEMRSQTWHFRHRHSAADHHARARVLGQQRADGPPATLKSMGFSILPEGIVQADVKEGALVRLLPEYSIDDPDMKVSIVYPGGSICLPRRASSSTMRWTT